MKIGKFPCETHVHDVHFYDFNLQFARTLICQGTLTPLSQNTMPIYWNMDASLALYPLPDLIVVGDPSKPFEIQHQGCTVVNAVRIFVKYKII